MRPELARRACRQDAGARASRRPRGATSPPPPPRCRARARRPAREDRGRSSRPSSTSRPSGDEWLHEMKFDGYRILARLAGRPARLLEPQRQGLDGAVPRRGRGRRARCPCGRAPRRRGRGRAARRHHQLPGPAERAAGAAAGRSSSISLFDLAPPRRLRRSPRAPSRSARPLLEGLLGAPARRRPLRYSDHVAGSGPEFFAQACGLGLEGIVSKRRDAPYEAGAVAALAQGEVPAAPGIRDRRLHRARRSRVGHRRAAARRVRRGRASCDFAGKVGTGFTAKVARRPAHGSSTRSSSAKSPFAEATIPGITRAHWVKPELVGEVAFTEWTRDGRLRHPSFQGLRADKSPRTWCASSASAVEEVAAAADARSGRREAGSAKQRQTAAEAAARGRRRAPHPSRRVLYPAAGITKRDLAQFYGRSRTGSCPTSRAGPLTPRALSRGRGEGLLLHEAQRRCGRRSPAPREDPGEDEGRRVPGGGRPGRPRLARADGHPGDPHLERAARTPSSGPTASCSISIPIRPSAGTAWSTRRAGPAQAARGSSASRAS